MARCMESMLTPAPAAGAADDVVAAPPAPPRPEPKPIQGISLILSVLADRLRRLLRRRNAGV